MEATEGDGDDMLYRNAFYSAALLRRGGDARRVGAHSAARARDTAAHEPYLADEALLGVVEHRAEAVALAYAEGVAQRDQQIRIGYVNAGAPLFGAHDAEADAVEAALD